MKGGRLRAFCLWCLLVAFVVGFCYAIVGIMNLQTYLFSR